MFYKNFNYLTNYICQKLVYLNLKFLAPLVGRCFRRVCSDILTTHLADAVYCASRCGTKKQSLDEI